MENQHPAYISKEMFSNAISNLGVENGDHVYVASSMATLGFMDNAMQSICELLIAAVGNEGTVIMPTFNFDFCKGVDFDINSTPSKVGVLTEYFRENYSSHRSSSPPYHSVCAKGRLASQISQVDSSTSFGENSVFQYMLDENVKYLLIGVGFDAVPSFHWIEEKVGVPYRFWKKFKGMVNRQTSSEEEYIMYARQEGFALDLNPLMDQFRESKSLSEETVGWCQLKSFSTQNFTNYFHPLIEKDPILLLDKSSKNLMNKNNEA